MYNNKLLAAIFVGLFALYTVTKAVKANQGSRTFRSQIVAIDTALVQNIVLNPQVEQHQEIRLSRTAQGWVLQRGQIQALAQNGKIAALLNSLRDVKPQRLVAKSKHKWATYQLTDSLATRVTLLGTNGRQLTSLLVGKAEKGGTVYVRLPTENEVYAIDNYTVASLNKPLNHWRNQDLLNFVSTQVDKVEFNYPADSSFTLKKDKEGWIMDDAKADSSLVLAYLNAIASKRSDAFVNDFQLNSAPQYMLTLSGKKLTKNGKPTPVIVQAFDKGNEVYLRSSVNPLAVFRSKKTGMFADIFKVKSDFIKNTNDKTDSLTKAN
ncbi:DUF4340 domain-containing protein [uncultured Microscilla sp.]|uniref:DUF4340 domain-containing protein n=1 Tax=uncultured Microscilla sp. TaxID=432653 RepID=UPI00262440FA|nr:DUF4340 domain-containing protein [uncultured Microscilla sp.]